MSEKQRPSKEISQAGEEQILEFEFDDLPDDHSGKTSSQDEDEEIIELVDIVEREEADQTEIGGETIELTEEVGKSFKVDEKAQEPLREEEAITLAGLENEKGGVQSLETEEEELDLEIEADLADDASQSLELDLDSALQELEPGKEEVKERQVPLKTTKQQEKEGEEEFKLDELVEEEGQQETEELKPPAEELEVSEAEQQASKDQLVGISEERLEQVVTEAVERVVERVAREAMTKVAEKLISEAIEALKESLEEASNTEGESRL